VHTIGARDTVFEVVVDGRPSSLHAVMPGLDQHDRLGLVVRSPLGGLGASALIFAMVIDFYRAHDAELRALQPGELLYPEHYVFHVGTAQGDYSWLDFWPPHKEVVVASDQLVQSLLDHGITRLLVQDTGADMVAATADAAASALERQLVTCLAYSPDGRTAAADVTVVSNPTVEHWVEITIDPVPPDPDTLNDRRFLERAERAGEVSEAERLAARSARHHVKRGSDPVETYRRLTAQQAAAMVSADATSGTH
jgi:hypothetical protein